MLDKFLVLLERFVVAHELLAANSGKVTPAAVEAEPVAPVVEEKPTRKPRATKAKPAPEPEPEEELEEEKPAPKPRATVDHWDGLSSQAKGDYLQTLPSGDKPKSRGKKQEKDIDVLRAEIKEMASHIATGDSDECDNEFVDLLDEFKVRTVTKLPDEDVAEFHGLAKEIVGKYYEFED